jgi:mycofactocin system glycosyltransferase
LLDHGARRSPDGLLIVGGAPGRLLRLTPAGRDSLDAMLRGELPDGRPAQRLLERLLEAGVIHPSGTRRPHEADSLTSVVPMCDGTRWLAPLIAPLRSAGPVIAVDDGSTDGSTEMAREAGALVLANSQLPGQSGARNTGLAAATTELVAFVDQDCIAKAGWLDHLVGLFDDASLALAAPRVRSVPGTSRLARYESVCSPLDLGPHPSLVGPGRCQSYVPSAAIVVRRSAVLEVGGFDQSMRVGEDVDLVCRLVAAGWRVRYAPESEIHHHPRATVSGMARQRFRYGESAPLLQRRHPGVATPLGAAPHTIAIWLAGATLGPLTAGLAVAASTLAAARAGGDPIARRELAAFVARGHLQATRHLAAVLLREWLPLTALACTLSRRARRVALGALVLDTVASRGNGPGRPDIASHLALRSVDLSAYAAGLWRAAVRERSLAALTLRVGSGRSARARATPPRPVGAAPRTGR